MLQLFQRFLPWHAQQSTKKLPWTGLRRKCRISELWHSRSRLQPYLHRKGLRMPKTRYTNDKTSCCFSHRLPLACHRNPAFETVVLVMIWCPNLLHILAISCLLVKTRQTQGTGCFGPDIIQAQYPPSKTEPISINPPISPSKPDPSNPSKPLERPATGGPQDPTPSWGHLSPASAPQAPLAASWVAAWQWATNPHPHDLHPHNPHVPSMVQ